MSTYPSIDPMAVASSDAAAVPVPEEALETPRHIELHPAVLKIWMFGTLMLVVPAVFITLIISFFTGKWLVLGLAIFIGSLLLIGMYVHSRAWISCFQCRLLEDGLWVDRGVFWRSEIFVARTRVQHTEVQQGPIARRFAIASLKVFTAGAGHGEIEIDGLKHHDALWLRDELLGRHSHDGV